MCHDWVFAVGGNNNEQNGRNLNAGRFLFMYGVACLGVALFSSAAGVLLWVFCAIRSAKYLHDSVWLIFNYNEFTFAHNRFCRCCELLCVPRCLSLRQLLLDGSYQCATCKLILNTDLTSHFLQSSKPVLKGSICYWWGFDTRVFWVFPHSCICCWYVLVCVGFSLRGLTLFRTFSYHCCDWKQLPILSPWSSAAWLCLQGDNGVSNCCEYDIYPRLP